MPEKEFLKIVEIVKPSIIYYHRKGWFDNKHAFTIGEKENERWTIVLNRPKELIEELTRKKITIVDIEEFEEVPDRVCE